MKHVIFILSSTGLLLTVAWFTISFYMLLTDQELTEQLIVIATLPLLFLFWLGFSISFAVTMPQSVSDIFFKK